MFSHVNYVNPGFFSRVTKFTTMEKMCNFYICVTSFLRIKNVLLANNTGYDFCVLNVLRCKCDYEKKENKIVVKITENDHLHFLKNNFISKCGIRHV